MFNIKKCLIAMLIIITLFSLVSCQTNINKDLIKNGSGIIVDVGEYTQEDSGSLGLSERPRVKFVSKKDFNDFFEKNEFSEEDLKRMAEIATLGKVELPYRERILGVKFGETENINRISWYGKNDYVYDLSIEYNENSFGAWVTPVLSVEELEDFLNKETEMPKTATGRTIYFENGIKYVKITGKNIFGENYTQYFWKLSKDGVKYYVHQHGDAYTKILVESKEGYQFVTLYNDDGVDVTPELVKQFKPYSYSITTK
ncbi:MAG: hypothetical protein IJX55_03405 [Clostridia bacterium]|nr:hypothetical protein [Clostridia bacterium]